MDDWYVIGVAVGVGVSLGVLAAGLLASSRFAVAGSTVAGVILGVAAGFVANRWIEADWLGPLAGVVGGVMGALCATVLVRGALRRGGTSGGTAFLVVQRSPDALHARARAHCRLRGGRRPPSAGRARAQTSTKAARRFAHAGEVTRKLIVTVVDGLGPAALESAIEAGDAPILAQLLEHGTYRRAVSVFPSLTPVCLSSIATGAYPDVHGIPHLVWYHRGEQRIVEYGSSFGALRTAGIGQTMRDALVNMNASHLAPDAVTVFEALEDAGLVTAAVNFTAYRGRTPHPAAVPFLGTVQRSDALPLLQPVGVRPDRRPAVLAQPFRRDGRCLCGGSGTVARDAGRVRLSRLLPLRLRLRLARHRARRRPRGAATGRRRRRRARSCCRRPGRAARPVCPDRPLRPWPDACPQRRDAGASLSRACPGRW